MSWRSKTYDELPALAIRGPQLRSSLKTVTTAWMLGIVWMTATQGAPAVQFCEMLGFKDWHFGLMAALPFIATFGQIFAATVVDSTGFKKYQFLHCSTASRLMWIPIAAIPLVLPLPSEAAVATMLAMLFISQLLSAMGTPACMMWLGDLIPRRIRGRYFAVRMLYSRPMQVATVLALWVVLDWATTTHAKVPTFAGEPRLMWTLCGVFVVAGLFGAADILMFTRVREVVRGESPTPGRRAPRSLAEAVALESARRPAGRGGLLGTLYLYMVQPLEDRVFRHYVLYGATLAFAMAAPGAFFVKNCMHNLGFSPGSTQFLFTVVSSVIGLIGARQWGKALDRWGRRPVLILSTLMTLLSVSPWLFARHDTPAPAFIRDSINWMLTPLAGWLGSDVLVSADAPVGAYLLALLCSFFGGIAWTGVALAQNNVMLSFSDGRGRSRYMAASMVLAAVGGVAGGLVGGWMAEWLNSRFALQQHPLEFWIFHWNQWHMTFLLSMAMRALSLLWLIGMPDPGAARARDMMRYMLTNVGSSLTGLLGTPLRIFGIGRPLGRGNRDEEGS